MNQPNIILFFGEDTGRHQGCYGDPYAHTPNIDRLAAEGCRYTHAFSTAPVCAPSRSAMITGQYATKLGSHHMRSTLLNPPRLWTQALQDAGYHVNWANKTDFNFEPPADFATVTEDWIDGLERGVVPDRPFMLYYNFSQTHESSMWPEGATPGIEPITPEPGPSSDEEAAALLGIPVPPYLPDTVETRCALRRYYTQLEAQDAMLGRVLDAVDRSGLADNTVIIYMTDHGRGLCREKRWLYEAGIHLPLIVRAPGLLQAGSVSEELVSWVDLAPTIHALACIDIPEPYDGRVFLGPNADAEPSCVFAARDRMDECFDRSRAARDRRYLYIRNDFPHLPWAQRLQYMETSPVTRQLRELNAAGQLPFPTDRFMLPTKPPEELFDTQADPHCVDNLADHPDHAATLARLRRAVQEWSAQIDDKGFVPERELITAGIVADRFSNYAQRINHLPEHLRANGVYDSTLQ